MRILVACEFSGVVRRAFRALGHDAWSCDLLPSLDSSEFHIVGDVLDVLDEGWDMMIAHPPCTYLCNSGVRWLYEKSGRWDKMRAGAEFFLRLWHADIPKIAVENPVMHSYARDIVGMYSQTIQPWQFGHPECKRTCLWLKNLPLLEETCVVEGRGQSIANAPDSKDRAIKRSITFEGIAAAMADQWQENEALKCEKHSG